MPRPWRTYPRLVAQLAALLRTGYLPPLAKGGQGSGHFGHAGRPGQVGGSLPGQGGGRSVTRQTRPRRAPVGDAPEPDDPVDVAPFPDALDSEDEAEPDVPPADAQDPAQDSPLRPDQVEELVSRLRALDSRARTLLYSSLDQTGEEYHQRVRELLPEARALAQASSSDVAWRMLMLLQNEAQRLDYKEDEALQQLLDAAQLEAVSVSGPAQGPWTLRPRTGPSRTFKTPAAAIAWLRRQGFH